MPHQTLIIINLVLLKIILAQSTNQPNILLILADDLGYNDVGYRGNNQVKTPNIDALAYNGAVLERFYTLPMCTPSRAAILTGKYPIRTGFQGLPFEGGEPGHLPENVSTLPEQLKKLGYKTHLVGKWHLGFAYRNVTPLAKGFDSHYGYYNGLINYFDHIYQSSTMTGFDFRDNFRVDRKSKGEYATDLFTNRAIKIINDHDYRKPMFLMVNHVAVHTGKVVGHQGIVEERNTTSMNKNFGYIKDVNRRRLVDALKTLDDSIGNIIKALSEKDVLDNTIIFFLSDNGGPTYGELYPNYSSNWPLRGIKISHFEGAVRGTGIFYSKNMTCRGKSNSNLMHMVDLLPTFYSAAGGNLKNLGQLDGINQLDVLMYNKKTKRKEVLINIEDVSGSAAIIRENGRYKLIQGIQYNGTYDSYGGETGRNHSDGPYDFKSVINSDVNQAFGTKLGIDSVKKLREDLRTKNCRKAKYEKSCKLCLFDLENDPCETTNLAKSKRGLTNEMIDRLDYFRSESVPQQHTKVDPKSNPKYYGGVWTFWLDKKPL
ncbi:arylsulfatase J-like [Onthophagus taurus]|uniref:arylsulfatase J-like n=1 Tax=Onthophagus taurus TaxID=166361 RepID=UPI0039BDFE52